MQTSNQVHWQTVYETKAPHEVSWTEEVPAFSLEIIDSLQLPLQASIVDVGGGDSHLVDYLLLRGYTNLTVLDISEAALNRAKKRLGHRASAVQWVVSNVLDWQPPHPFDLWHDRAAFHFMVSPEQVDQYLRLMTQFTKGFSVLAAFSENGPEKCSGLPVKRYQEGNLCKLMNNRFEKISCKEHVHITPMGKEQEFLYCGFRKGDLTVV